MEQTERGIHLNDQELGEAGLVECGCNCNARASQIFASLPRCPEADCVGVLNMNGLQVQSPVVRNEPEQVSVRRFSGLDSLTESYQKKS